jgi:tetratricopeptide (TPR) repeat protein
VLSLAALREVYWRSGRNDLLQAHLFDCLASVDPNGASRDPDVARLHLMLGHALHNSGNVAAATGAFRRAHDIFSGAPDHRREAGVALAALGRSQRRLDRLSEAEQSFRAAVAILDEVGDESMHLTFALSWLADLLAQQDRMDEATPLAQRLVGIVEHRPVAGGLASLHELVGGTPSGMTARLRVLKLESRPK